MIHMVPLGMFDWKEFHRVILRSGPLGSLELLLEVSGVGGLFHRMY